MRIRWRALGVCVAMGVGTTIALAWLLAIVRPSGRPVAGLFAVDHTGGVWMGFGEKGPGWREYTIYGTKEAPDAHAAYALSLPQWLDTTAQGPMESRAVTAIGVGWPLICMHARRVGVGHDQPPPGTNAWHTGLGPQWVDWGEWHGGFDWLPSTRRGAPDDGCLPMRVYVPGFVTNALLFTLVWSLPFLVAAGRRAWRRRGGRCTRCGYDLRGIPNKTCPECGSKPQP